MNELDNWYKNNIKNQRIPPYQDSYWQAASAFMARAEKLRKLKLIERSMSIFLLLLASISLFGLVDRNSEDKAKATPEPIAMIDESPKETYKEIVDEASNTADFSAQPNLSNTNNESDALKPTTSPSELEKNEKTFVQKELRNTETTGSEIALQDKSTSNIIKAEPQNDHPAEIANTPEDEGLEVAEEVETLKKTMSESDALIAEMMAVEFLPYPEMLLLKEEAKFELKPFAVVGNTIPSFRSANNPYFRKSLSMGLPFAVNSGVDGGKWMGGNLSLQAEYHFNANWMVSAGLGYAMRKGPVGIIHDHPISEYNYEMRDKGYWMTIDELHYVTVPISVHYKMNKLGVGVGYRPMGLASARAAVASYDHHRTFSDQGVVVHTETSNEERGWAKPSGLRSFTHEFTGMVSYQIAPHWRAMASLAFNPMGNTDDGFGLRYDDVKGDYQKAYQVSRPFQADALFAEITIQYLW